jgi:hypothetical protein
MAAAAKGTTPSSLMRGYSSFIPMTVQRAPSIDEIGENVSSNRAIASAVFASSRQNLNLPNGFGMASPTAASASADAAAPQSAFPAVSANTLAVPAPASASASAPTNQLEQMNSMMQAMMAQMARQQQLQKEQKEAKELREKQEREEMLQKMMAQMMNFQPQTQSLGSSQSQPGLPVFFNGMAASASQSALPPAASAASTTAVDMSSFEQFQKFQKMLAAQAQQQPKVQPPPPPPQPQSQMLAPASGMLPVVIAPSPSSLRRLSTLHAAVGGSGSSSGSSVGFNLSAGGSASQARWSDEAVILQHQ